MSTAETSTPNDPTTPTTATAPRGASAEASIAAWLAGRLPEQWFIAAPEVTVDREEIVVVGPIAAPGDDQDPRAAERGRIARLREETREQRIAIAREAERAFGRKVSWGAACGETREVFTSLSTPVMTRLRQPERRVLDTLVEAGVARSRSDALAWAVRLVGQHVEDWLAELRAAMEDVRRVRAQGPIVGG
jgi:hypothetical protein